MSTFFLISGIVIVFLLIIGIYLSVTSEGALVEERLGKLLDEEQPSAGKKAKGDSLLTEWVNRRVEKTSLGDRIAKDLARADLKIKPGEYIALYFIAIVGTAFIAWLIGGQDLISPIIGGIIGSFLPRLYIRRQQSRRLIKFNDQLSDMLNLMVNGLRAGFSTMQAMEAVSKELPSPISDEFRRVVQEMQLGLPMERALDNLMRRIESKDLDLVVTALNVQREVGGNLAEILATISHTIRERVRIKGEIRVLTTQVMTSAKFLSAMPIFVVVALYFVQRPY